MPLTITVKKISAAEPMPGLITIVLNLTCEDGALEVINKDFTLAKKTAVPIGVVQERARVAMQKVIDEYKRAQVLYTSTALDNAVAALEVSLVG